MDLDKAKQLLRAAARGLIDNEATYEDAKREFDRMFFIYAVKKHKYVTRAASHVGLHRNTIYRLVPKTVCTSKKLAQLPEKP